MEDKKKAEEKQKNAATYKQTNKQLKARSIALTLTLESDSQ